MGDFRRWQRLKRQTPREEGRTARPSKRVTNYATFLRFLDRMRQQQGVDGMSTWGYGRSYA